MSFASLKFEFPFEPGEPIFFPILSFAYKETYDKYYVLDGKEYLSRYEVAHVALKHQIMNSYGINIPMHNKAIGVFYQGYDGWVRNQHIYKPAPEYFGMWIGRYIPIMPKATTPLKNPGKLTDLDLEPLAMQWTSEFFETHTDFWMEILPGKEHPTLKEYARTGKTLWIRWDMTTMWIPRYQELRAQGLTKDIRTEQQLLEISRYIDTTNEEEK